MFNGHARAASRSRTLSESVDIDLVIPMAYGRVLIELPTGFAISATANVIGYSGNSLQDLFRTNRLCIRLRRGRRSRGWGTAVLP